MEKFCLGGEVGATALEAQSEFLIAFTRVDSSASPA
jgi:hypothetical protein